MAGVPRLRTRFWSHAPRNLGRCLVCRALTLTSGDARKHVLYLRGAVARRLRGKAVSVVEVDDVRNEHAHARRAAKKRKKEASSFGSDQGPRGQSQSLG